jgi:hypothetical protein
VAIKPERSPLEFGASAIPKHSSTSGEGEYYWKFNAVIMCIALQLADSFIKALRQHSMLLGATFACQLLTDESVIQQWLLNNLHPEISWKPPGDMSMESTSRIHALLQDATMGLGAISLETWSSMEEQQEGRHVETCTRQEVVDRAS